MPGSVPLEDFQAFGVILMKIRIGVLSAAALAVAILSAPLALAANTKADAFIQKAIEGNLAEIKVGQLAQQKGASDGVRHHLQLAESLERHPSG